MSLANPIWLWGLTGLAIPFAIHLLSRKEGKVIRIGSIRHLSESTTQQFKSIRLNEILLLLVRSVFIILIVLLLAGLRIHSDALNKWVLVDPSLWKHPQVVKWIDSLVNDGFQLKSWSTHFDDKTDTADPINHWKVLDQLTQVPVKDVVVIARTRISQFRNDQEPLPPFVKWIQVDEPPSEFILLAQHLSADSVTIRQGHTDSDKTEFISMVANKSMPGIDTLTIRPSPDITVYISADRGFEHDKKILIAALKSISSTSAANIKVKTEFNSNDTTAWNIWLSEKEIPPFKGPMIYYESLPFGKLIDQVEIGKWRLRIHLDEHVALQENLPTMLAEIIIPSAAEKVKSSRNDQRVMPEKMRWSTSNVKAEATQNLASIDNWLLILLAAAWMLERWISHQKRL